MRALLKSILILSLLFLGCISMIRAQPYDDTPLRDLLQPAGCSDPCWHGIRPGSTSVTEAIALLQSNSWVMAESIEQAGARLRWQWSGTQPAMIDSAAPGVMLVSNDRVFSITMPLNVGMGDLQLLFGAPNWSSRGRYRHEAFIQYSYPRQHLSLLLSVQCPMVRQSYWHSRPQITLSSGLMRGVSYTPGSSYLKLC